MATIKLIFWGEGPDGVAKTPQWASQITGIPAEKNHSTGTGNRQYQTGVYQPGMGATAPRQRRNRDSRYLDAGDSDR